MNIRNVDGKPHVDATGSNLGEKRRYQRKSSCKGWKPKEQRTVKAVLKKYGRGRVPEKAYKLACRELDRIGFKRSTHAVRVQWLYTLKPKKRGPKPGTKNKPRKTTTPKVEKYFKKTESTLSRPRVSSVEKVEGLVMQKLAVTKAIVELKIQRDDLDREIKACLK